MQRLALRASSWSTARQETCEISYPGEHGFPQIRLHEFQFQGTSPAVGLALGAVEVVARDNETRQPWGLLRNGYFHADRSQPIAIMPASPREVANMPPTIRHRSGP